jgi:glycosyltransferase involved in cell wall biosynthesis
MDKYSNVASLVVIDGAMDILPVVSIMIPTYNRPALLKETLQSALNQITDFPFEVVVVDNSSDNYSMIIDEIVQSYLPLPIRLFRNSSNIGMYGNWNRCALLARANWICILNDDDLISTNFVENAFQCTSENVSIICAEKVVFDERKLREDTALEVLKKIQADKRDAVFKKMLFEYLIFSNLLGNSSGLLINKQFFLLVGGANELNYPSSDYYTWIEMGKLGDLIIMKNVFCLYRIGFNDSLKFEVLTGFIIKDYLMRLSLCKNYQIYEKFIFKILMMLSATRALRNIKAVWGVDVSNESGLALIGYKTWWSYFKVNKIEMLYRIFIRLGLLRKPK